MRQTEQQLTEEVLYLRRHVNALEDELVKLRSHRDSIHRLHDIIDKQRDELQAAGPSERRAERAKLRRRLRGILRTIDDMLEVLS